MLDHHIQRSIVYKLAFTPEARFSELKPDDIENKLFTYHLKKVISEGYVVKSDDGLYTLTPEGRRMSTGAIDKQKELLVERPLSVLLLVVRRKSDGAWLMYTRKTHPNLGMSGFMHCQPSAADNVEVSASLQCRAKTGLVGTFKALGGGYIRIFRGHLLESFNHFTLLYCDDIQGELSPEDTRADYFWQTQPTFSGPELLPSTQMLHDAYVAGKPFFQDVTYTIQT